MGLLDQSYGLRDFVGLAILVTFITAGWVWNNHRLPWWSLMAVGMLAFSALIEVMSLLGELFALGLTVLQASRNLTLLLLLFPWGGLVGLLWAARRRQRLARRLWPWVVGAAVSSLLIEVQPINLQQLSWAAVFQVIIIGGWVSGVALLGVTLGLWAARRFGRLAMLFALGMIYLTFQHLLTPLQANPAAGDALLLILGQSAVPLLFIVLAPLAYLCQGSSSRQIVELGALVGLAVVIDRVLDGLARQNLMWLTGLRSLPILVSVLLLIGYADALYTTQAPPDLSANETPLADQAAPAAIDRPAAGSNDAG